MIRLLSGVLRFVLVRLGVLDEFPLDELQFEGF